MKTQHLCSLLATTLLCSLPTASAQVPFGDVVLLDSTLADDPLMSIDPVTGFRKQITNLPSDLWNRLQHVDVDAVNGDLIVGARAANGFETEIWRLSLELLDITSATLIGSFGFQREIVDTYRETSGSVLALIADPNDATGEFLVARVGLTSQGHVLSNIAHTDPFPQAPRTYLAVGAREDGDVVIVYNVGALGSSKAYRVSAQGGILMDASSELSSVDTEVRGIGFVEMPGGPQVVEVGKPIPTSNLGGHFICGSLVATLNCPTSSEDLSVEGIDLVEGTNDSFYAAVNCRDPFSFPFVTTGEIRRLDTANCSSVSETVLYQLPTGTEILGLSERSQDSAYGSGCALNGTIPLARGGPASRVNGWLVEVENGIPNGVAYFALGTNDVTWLSNPIPTSVGRQCHVLQSTEALSSGVNLDASGSGFAVISIQSQLSIGSSLFGQWLVFPPAGGGGSFELSSALKTTVLP